MLLPTMYTVDFPFSQALSCQIRCLPPEPLHQTIDYLSVKVGGAGISSAPPL